MTLAVVPSTLAAPSVRRMVTRRCLGCGEPFEAIAAQTPAQEFCCNAHKRTWQNRRATRGALAYDLLMAWRCERDIATPLKIWSCPCRLAREFRDEDKRERAGRRSWRSPRAVIWERPWLSTTIVRSKPRGQSQ